MGMVFDARRARMKGQTNRHILDARLQRRLRNDANHAERALWQRLKDRQLDRCKFRRRHPCGDAVEHDAARTRSLEEARFIVLRFWNNDVFGTIDGVLEMIHRHLVARATPSPPNPPLEGEG